MLPLPADADQDTAANTVTVENKYLDFSSDVYANIDLDSQTTVDVGDFLMFYTGDFTKQTGEDAATITKYGKITDVEERKILPLSRLKTQSGTMYRLQWISMQMMQFPGRNCWRV